MRRKKEMGLRVWQEKLRASNYAPHWAALLAYLFVITAENEAYILWPHSSLGPRFLRSVGPQVFCAISRYSKGMSFRYDRLKKSKESGQEFWASYADLYTMLSFVFLFLFAVANIRGGSGQVTKQIENVKLAKENDDLREQIKVYESLKDNYLQTKASTDDRENYDDLMDKLKLLAQENKQEATDLRLQANENEKKEKALNKYQQMIRNIINANLLAKEQINTRDTTIVEKNTTIKEKSQVISKLEVDVAGKEKEISQNQKKIGEIETALQRKIAAIKAERKNSKITATQMKVQIAKITQNSQQKISSLESANSETKSLLNQAQGELEQTTNALAQTQGTLKAKQAALGVAEAERQRVLALAAQTKGELERASGQLAATQGSLKEKVTALGEAEEQRQRALSAANQAKGQLGQLKGELEKTAGALANTEGDLRAKEAALGEAEGARQRAMASVEGLKKANKSISADLEQAQALLKAKSDLVAQIQSEFAKKGIKAQVNGKSGDVTLDFGEEYFETSSSDLKPGMVSKLRGFFPAYAEALFKDKKLAQKVANVEIIGFASPTFNGRYVNPASISPEDQEAINYNLKLSFNRASAIFKYAFDQNKVTFNGQKALLPMVKVVGRGYLPEGVTGSQIPEGLSEKDFCKKFNCKRAQRVIIKFNLQE